MATIEIEMDSATSSLTLTLNRPDKRNALSAEMIDELVDALDGAMIDDDVRSIQIKGAGTAFCAGADLAEIQAMQTATVQENQASSHHLASLFHMLYSLPKPTIAVVDGPALAGGAGLASCCDFILASEQATFGYPEVKIGFVPAIVMILLTRQVGERAARDLCLSGRAVGAAEAFRLGLVNQLVEGDLKDAADKLAKKLRNNSPQSMETVKDMFRRLHGMNLDDGMEWAADMNALARGTDDCKEGIAAFLEKRKPGWIE
ncbi:MAG: enoyl-CoA hydratase-related protein [Planctomycetes bacterium]|nr:enoyl-CoA hydratase-related protein [Planctomycetota bacterium]